MKIDMQMKYFVALLWYWICIILRSQRPTLSNTQRTIHKADTCFKLAKEIREKSKLKVPFCFINLPTFVYGSMADISIFSV